MGHVLWDMCYGTCVMGHVLWDMCYGTCVMRTCVIGIKGRHLWHIFYVKPSLANLLS